MSEDAGRPRRTVWNTAPGVEAGDEALLAEWHKRHPVRPWRGKDGRGGFVGWANRLDEKVAQRGYLMPPRSEVISVRPREMYREILHSMRRPRMMFVFVVAIALCVVSPAFGAPVLALTLSYPAARTIRARKRDAMRAELLTETQETETRPAHSDPA